MQAVGQSAPIIRYHRPTDKQQYKNATSSRSKELDQQKSDKKIRSALLAIFRFSGVGAIVLIVLANTTISSVTLKVSGDRESYQSLSVYTNEINSMVDSSIASSSKFLLNSS